MSVALPTVFNTDLKEGLTPTKAIEDGLDDAIFVILRVNLKPFQGEVERLTRSHVCYQGAPLDSLPLRVAVPHKILAQMIDHLGKEARHVGHPLERRSLRQGLWQPERVISSIALGCVDKG